MEEFDNEIGEGQPPVEAIVIERQIPLFARTSLQREDIAKYLVSRVEQGLEAYEGLLEVWETVFSQHRNDPPEATEDIDLQQIHIPFLGPRIDTLTSNVCTVVAKQDPIMLCESGGDDDASSRAEAAVHKHWIQGGFSLAVREAALYAALTNMGIWRVSYQTQVKDISLSEDSDQINELNPTNDPINFSGIKLDVIKPTEFVIGPTSIDGIQSASFCGHRFYLKVGTVKEYQRRGLYFGSNGEDILGGDSPADDDILNEYEYSHTEPNVFEDADDLSLVECWEIYFKYPARKNSPLRWYRAVVARDPQYVLDVEPWPYSRPPYFVSSFVTDTVNFWGGRSVGRDLSVLQDMYDKTQSLVYSASFMKAFPPIFGSRIQDGDFTSYGPGEYIELEGGAQSFSPAVQVDFNGLLQQLAAIERQGDIVARVSTNSLGAEEAHGNVTATQTASINQGQAVGLQEYIAQFTLQFPAMAQFSCELLADNFILWKPYYARPILRDDLLGAFEWEPNGQSPASTPAARLQALQMFFALAKDPATGLDVYELTKLALGNSGIPGAAKLQKERQIETGPSTQLPQQQGDQAPSGPSFRPQQGLPGQDLQPLPEALSRPGSFNGDSDASGGESTD